MSSPFPGMDPYLEKPARWPDVYQRLITYIADALQPQVRPHYHARIGERVYILQPPRALYPDILLIGQPVREPVQEIIHSPAHLIEIDLLAEGLRNSSE